MLLEVVGTVAVLVVAIVPVSASVEDRVVLLQPLAMSPTSATMKSVFFIGGFELPAD